MKQSSALPEGITYLDEHGSITRYDPLHGATDQKLLGKNFFALRVVNNLLPFDYADYAKFLESEERTKVSVTLNGAKITFFRINSQSVVVLSYTCNPLTLEDLFEIEPVFSIQNGELVIRM